MVTMVTQDQIELLQRSGDKHSARAYLLSASMVDEDLEVQTAVHLADQQSRRLQLDHDALLGGVQPQCRRADFGCRDTCVMLFIYFNLWLKYYGRKRKRKKKKKQQMLPCVARLTVPAWAEPGGEGPG